MKLDLFHAVQRITRTLSKKEKFYKQLISELRMVFRNAGDIGIKRMLPTPDTETILVNLENFIARWKELANLKDKTMKELTNLKKHVTCLSNIPFNLGTNRNEALHRHLNPYFIKTRLGVQAGYAFLCLLLWLHNRKVLCTSDQSEASPDSEVCHNSSMSHDHTYLKAEIFGILGKAQTESNSFWGTNRLMKFRESIDMINDIDDTEDSGLISNIDAKLMILEAVNTAKIIEASQNLFSNSPLLRKEFLPFAHSCFELRCIESSSNLTTDQVSDHEQRLNNLIRVCGLMKLPVPKDGDCFFTYVLLALKILNKNANLGLKTDIKNLPVDVEAENTETMSKMLRRLVYNEWVEFPQHYEDYLIGENLVEEASKFLVQGFFMSSLGDTVVSALCNALKIPIIVLSSIPGTPILQFKPRSFIVHAPLIIAYNQFLVLVIMIVYRIHPV